MPHSLFSEGMLTNSIITSEDVKIAKSSWNMILGNPTGNLLRAQRMDGFEHISNLTWFHDLFNGKFFSICPDAITLFVGVGFDRQGRLISALVSSCLNILDGPIELKQRLRAMISSYTVKGVQLAFYAHIGTALTWALDNVLGVMFDDRSRASWKLIYSYLLGRIITPLVSEVGHRQKILRTAKRMSRRLSFGADEGVMPIREVSCKMPVISMVDIMPSNHFGGERQKVPMVRRVPIEFCRLHSGCG